MRALGGARVYTGRWYNVYYDLPTLPFSTPDCQTAFYAKVESEYPILTVNNSGLCYANIGLGCTGNPADYKVNGQTPTYITGHASQKGGAAAGDLTLNLDGVGRESTYRIAKLGPKTYGAGYYQYSVVSDDSGVILFVLARDVDEFFATYDDEVLDFLKKYARRAETIIHGRRDAVDAGTTSRARSLSRARTSRTRRTAPPATPSTSASSTRRRRRPSSPTKTRRRPRRARATPTASACRPAARPTLMAATRATSARCWAAR